MIICSPLNENSPTSRFELFTAAISAITRLLTEVKIRSTHPSALPIPLSLSPPHIENCPFIHPENLLFNFLLFHRATLPVLPSQSPPHLIALPLFSLSPSFSLPPLTPSFSIYPSAPSVFPMFPPPLFTLLLAPLPILQLSFVFPASFHVCFSSSELINLYSPGCFFSVDVLPLPQNQPYFTLAFFPPFIYLTPSLPHSCITFTFLCLFLDVWIHLSLS